MNLIIKSAAKRTTGRTAGRTTQGATKRNKSCVAMLPVLLIALNLVSFSGCSSDSGANLAARSPRGGEISYDDTTKQYDGSGYYNGIMTFEEILEKSETTEGVAFDGQFSEGAYIVSNDGVMKPGLYYVEGSPSELNTYEICKPSSKGEGLYYGSYALEYLSFYLLEADEGDVVVYKPANPDCQMSLAPSSALDVQPPYGSGCYRVGIDIPAGDYIMQENVSVVSDVPDAETKAGAYIMQDLLFDNNSIIQEVTFHGERTLLFTVEDGQYLELFAASARPVQ